MTHSRGFSFVAKRIKRILWAAFPLLAVLCRNQLCAQQSKTFELTQILKQLDSNLAHYDASVPSLFCDERVVSHMDPSAGHRDTVTDSVFRLTRVSNGDHSARLDESREIRTVNGKTPDSQTLEGPSVLSGFFEGALAVVSQKQTSCIKYSLERAKKGQNDGPYIVSFATDLNSRNTEDCLLQEKSKGFVSIDPATMQIIHLELTTAHHLIVPGDRYSNPVIGRRSLTVDYAPVRLDEETFWMPVEIKSIDVGDPGTFHTTVWSFQATYSNYHRMKVTQRILPTGGSVVR